jgi:hypothetical protein
MSTQGGIMGVILSPINTVSVSEEFMSELNKLVSVKGFGFNQLSVHASMLFTTIANMSVEKKVTVEKENELK